MTYTIYTDHFGYMTRRQSFSAAVSLADDAANHRGEYAWINSQTEIVAEVREAHGGVVYRATRGKGEIIDTDTYDVLPDAGCHERDYTHPNPRILGQYRTIGAARHHARRTVLYGAVIRRHSDGAIIQ